MSKTECYKVWMDEDGFLMYSYGEDCDTISKGAESKIERGVFQHIENCVKALEDINPEAVGDMVELTKAVRNCNDIYGPNKSTHDILDMFIKDAQRILAKAKVGQE